ncbi:MAG: hypothetical protein MJZ63_06670 [Muribaculaceae bacterium]|nr:hypothetical protein [Muribaculaceae bacterium]
MTKTICSPTLPEKGPRILWVEGGEVFGRWSKKCCVFFGELTINGVILAKRIHSIYGMA